MDPTANVQAYAKLAGRNGDANFERRMPGHVGRIQQAAKQAQDEANKPLIAKGFITKLLIISFLLLVVSVLMYLIASFYGDDISRGGHSASTEKLEIIIENLKTSFVIPTNAEPASIKD